MLRLGIGHIVVCFVLLKVNFLHIQTRLFCFFPIGPEVELLQVSENVSDAVNDEVPGKIFICSRGFSEADWNYAYSTWCTAINYEEEEDDELYPDVDG